MVSFKDSLGLRKIKITDENLNNTSFVKKLEQEDVYINGFDTINDIKTKVIIFDKSDLLFEINKEIKNKDEVSYALNALLLHNK